jgi:hypothetical protein
MAGRDVPGETARTHEAAGTCPVASFAFRRTADRSLSVLVMDSLTVRTAARIVPYAPLRGRFVRAAAARVLPAASGEARPLL